MCTYLCSFLTISIYLKLLTFFINKSKWGNLLLTHSGQHFPFGVTRSNPGLQRGTIQDTTAQSVEIGNNFSNELNLMQQIKTNPHRET